MCHTTKADDVRHGKHAVCYIMWVKGVPVKPVYNDTIKQKYFKDAILSLNKTDIFK
jgi:hypothetical protein